MVTPKRVDHIAHPRVYSCTQPIRCNCHTPTQGVNMHHTGAMQHPINQTNKRCIVTPQLRVHANTIRVQDNTLPTVCVVLNPNEKCNLILDYRNRHASYSIYYTTPLKLASCQNMHAIG